MEKQKNQPTLLSKHQQKKQNENPLHPPSVNPLTAFTKNCIIKKNNKTLSNKQERIAPQITKHTTKKSRKLSKKQKTKIIGRVNTASKNHQCHIYICFRFMFLNFRSFRPPFIFSFLEYFKMTTLTPFTSALWKNAHVNMSANN